MKLDLLKAQIERWKYFGYDCDPQKIAPVILKLIERVEDYEDALKFYADPLKWCLMGNGAYEDIGKKARAVLEGKYEKDK